MVFAMVVAVTASVTLPAPAALAADGTCPFGVQVGTDCGDELTFEGCCSDSTLFWCEPDGTAACALDCGGSPSCGWSEPDGFYDCRTLGEPEPIGAHPLECTWECEADCGDRECGADGCLGSCGSCKADEFCSDAGVCVECTCHCRDCGDDGCGNPCGTCEGGKACDGDGLCVDEPVECQPQDTNGCEDCECAACVCALDPFCCDTNWDGQCAAHCVDCGTECPCPVDCKNRECGGDGCGGSCGECELGFDCRDGKCEFCTCEGKQCGDDGCGTPCAVTPEGWACNDDGIIVNVLEQCVAKEEPGCKNCECEDCVCAIDAFCCEHAWDALCVGFCEDECGHGECACVPDCSTFECGGFDGCGGHCGECDEGQFCHSAGFCLACNCALKECGDSGCGNSCGECEEGEVCEVGTCKAVCVPDCEGKECGFDGCGGSCGLCAAPLVCGNGVCFDPGPDPDASEDPDASTQFDAADGDGDDADVGPECPTPDEDDASGQDGPGTESEPPGTEAEDDEDDEDDTTEPRDEGQRRPSPRDRDRRTRREATSTGTWTPPARDPAVATPLGGGDPSGPSGPQPEPTDDGSGCRAAGPSSAWPGVLLAALGLLAALRRRRLAPEVASGRRPDVAGSLGLR